MKTLFTFTAIVGFCFLCALVFLPSCSSFRIPTNALPFDFGVRYELEPDLFLVVKPADKGGLDVEFDGSGSLFAGVKLDDGNWSLTSPRTGIIYTVTQQPSGRPLITATGGSGKLKIVPTTVPKIVVVEETTNPPTK